MNHLFFTVPGEPRNVFARPVNSSTIEVRWDPPDDSDKNGQIRGYQIYVQPKNVSFAYIHSVQMKWGILDCSTLVKFITSCK